MMVQQFSSREAALSEARARLQGAKPPYRPKGIRYDSYEKVFSTIGNRDGIWFYPAAGAIEGTVVTMSIRDHKYHDYSVYARHDDYWYPDYPEPPYLLYQCYEWTNSETVFVCEGEKSADAVEALGLPATTALGGPCKVTLSDWSAMRKKHVVVLRDVDAQGGRYADRVSQFSLGCGALSARIVTLPGLTEQQNVAQWLEQRLQTLTREQVRAEIAEYVTQATPVEYVKPPYRPPAGPRADLRCLAEITPEPLEWVFEGVVPRGKLTVLTGETGVGKSLITLEMVKAVTFGDRGPAIDESQDPGAVILFTPAANLSDSICPCLTEGGADLSKVYALCGVREFDTETAVDLDWSFNLDRDLPILEAELQRLQIQEIAVRMVVIDPVDCYLGPSSESLKKGSDNTANRLAALAARTGVAIVAVSHWSPSNAGALSRLLRQSSSTGPFIAAAHSVWVVLPHLDDANRRLLLPVKTKCSPPQTGLTCMIENSNVEWDEEPVSMTVDDYLTSSIEQSRQQKLAPVGKQSQLSRAIEWVRKRLMEGPVASEVLERDAGENLITTATLKRARDELNCITSRPEGSTGRWFWSLPDDLELIPIDQLKR